MGVINSMLIAAWAAVGGLVALSTPAAAQAQQAYVTANTLNCRDAASPSAELVTKLAYRDRVAVQTEEAGCPTCTLRAAPAAGCPAAT